MATKRVQMDKSEASLIAHAFQMEAKKLLKDGSTASSEKYAQLADKYWAVVASL